MGNKNSGKRREKIPAGTTNNEWTVLEDDGKLLTVQCSCGRICKKTKKEIFGYKHSKSCGCKTKELIAKTNMERYGVPNPMYSESIKNKMKSTNLEKYGCEYTVSSPEVRKKIDNTCLERYGSKCSLNDENIRSKAKQTTREHFGVDWAASSPEVRKKIKQSCIESLGVDTPFKSKEIRENIRRTMKEKYGNEFYSASEEGKQKIKEACQRLFGADNFLASKEGQDACKKTVMERYGVEHIMQAEEFQKKVKSTLMERYGVDSPAKIPGIREKIDRTNLEKYGNTCSIHGIDVYSKVCATNIERYGTVYPMQNRDVRGKQAKSAFQPSGAKNLADALVSRGFLVVTEWQANDCNKCWDIAVMDNSGQPTLLIDVDGEYHHGYLSDPYTKRQGSYHYDNNRITQAPRGVKILLVDHLNVYEALRTISDILSVTYNEWIDNMVTECSGLPFPYPHYTEQRMRKDYQHLCEQDRYEHYIQTANSIVLNFHPSIYHARVGDHKSPVEAWEDPELLRKCVENRWIYKPGPLSSYHVARGFEVNKLAPRVSVFKPSFANYLLQKYAPNAKTAVDPFSGYSGRLLGAASLGMSYRGFDIVEKTVEESNNIIKFLNLENCFVSLVEPGWYPDGEHDALLTCPPYAQKEIWTDGMVYKSSVDYVRECLDKVKASVQIFVTDEMWEGKCTEEVRQPKSLFGKPKEYVLVFNKNGELIQDESK